MDTACSHLQKTSTPDYIKDLTVNDIKDLTINNIKDRTMDDIKIFNINVKCKHHIKEKQQH